MNVRELDDGKVLVICRSGCSNEEIISATGLSWGALFPASDDSQKRILREERRFPANDVLAALADEAWIVAVAASNLSHGTPLSDEDRKRLWIACERINKARDLALGER